jgi:hypothetical protein
MYKVHFGMDVLFIVFTEIFAISFAIWKLFDNFSLGEKVSHLVGMTCV